MISGITSDLRHACRQLVKNRGFACVTLLTLALCIGANTAIFSAVYALMLKPMPYAEPDRIVEIYNTYIKAGVPRASSNVVQYLDYKQNTKSFAHFGLWIASDGMVGEDGAAERLTGGRSTADFFDVLGLKPLIGQFFTAENHLPAASKVIVLSESFWKVHYQEDPQILGKTVRLDGETYTVVGVAPRGLEAFNAKVRFVRPFSWAPESINPGQRDANNPSLFARLTPGISPEQAQIESDMLEKRYYDGAGAATQQFRDRSGHKIAVVPIQKERVGPLRSTLLLLQGGVVIVLLIGCVNVANLMLARAHGRQSELAVRFALGATRAIIGRQLLIESLLLTTLGTVLGTGVAWAAVGAFNRYRLQMMPEVLPFAIDSRVLGFAIVTSVVAAVLISVAPMVHVLRANLMELIHRSSRGASGVRTLSTALVVGQVAIALVLLTGAGLLIHSFMKAIAVNPGFDPKGVVVGRVAVPLSQRSSPDVSRNFRERVVAAMKEIPGVTNVALSSATPFRGGLPLNAFQLADDTLPPGAPQPGASRVVVSVDYFATLQIPLIEGRYLEPADLQLNRPTYVVDQDFARKYFPGKSAVGGKISFGGRPANEADWPVIVGVVGNVPHRGVEDKSGVPFIYQPVAGVIGGGSVFLRTERNATEVIGLMREKLRAIDPGIALYDTSPLQDAIDDSYNQRRAVMLLLGGFAALALFLSALGIYGVLAYDVSQRTREIGVRGAIGATQQQVIGLVMRQGLWKTVIGLALGLIGAFLLSRYLSTLLFDLSPTDPSAYLAVSVLFLAVAALASYLPARRASRINPVEALRVD